MNFIVYYDNYVEFVLYKFGSVQCKINAWVDSFNGMVFGKICKRDRWSEKDNGEIFIRV